MKATILILVAGCAIVAAQALEAKSGLWKSYKEKYGKRYESVSEELKRRALFEQSVQQVALFNAEKAEELGYVAGVNHLSDRTPEERKQLNGFRVELLGDSQAENSAEAQAYLDKILSDSSPVPAELDWRKVPGRVSEVKNQGQCGSCWAFSATGALEGQEVGKKGGKLVGLSEQNLLDCSKENHACQGGLPQLAFDFVKKEGGLDDEKSYPYTARKSAKCHFNSSNVAITDQGYSSLEQDEEVLKKVVAHYGPVSVGMTVEPTFEVYKSGIYNNPYCDNVNLNHGVLVVGYGTDAKYGDYWIVKNSWGAAWGENGYVRMARNKDNQCGIVTLATIPIV